MDREKVKAFLQHLGMNAYEYKQADDTVCGYDYLEVERIADDALAILKEQEADMIALKNAYKELAEKGSVIVRCKECKHFYKDDFGLPICMEHKKLWIKDNWFCADGERKEGR